MQPSERIPDVADETAERVSRVIRHTFRQPDLQVTADTTADDVDGWDSLTHTILLLNIEREFGLRFAPLEVLDLDKVGDLVALVHQKLVT